MKALIINRCSTDESRQSVNLQTKPCVEYCIKNNWEYDIISYYGSASKRIPDELQKALDLIAQKKYDVLIVYSMDRFSRLHPRITEKMLNHVTECDCRFISILESLDSDNTMMWFAMKGLWMYFANLYSVNLSIKVKEGMAKAKSEGKPIGRPKGATDRKQRSKKGYYNRKLKFKLNEVVK